jgi:hypothetical protein
MGYCMTGPAIPGAGDHTHRVRCAVGPPLELGVPRHTHALGAFDLQKSFWLVLALGVGAWWWTSRQPRRNPRPYRRNRKLTAAARRRIPSARFAMPGLRKLPIHDVSHLRNAMSRFGQVKGATHAQRRAAYRKIVRAAFARGIDASGFMARWGPRYG